MICIPLSETHCLLSRWMLPFMTNADLYSLAVTIKLEGNLVVVRVKLRELVKGKALNGEVHNNFNPEAYNNKITSEVHCLSRYYP